MGAAMATRTTDPTARTGLFRTTPPGPSNDRLPAHDRQATRQQRRPRPTPTRTRAAGIRGTIALRDLLRRARELVADLGRMPPGPGRAAAPAAPEPAAAPTRYDPLRRVVLTDEVSRTLFDEYAAHRAGDRGREETGWVLLGVRGADEATALATLPAAADRDAGEAHVWITGPAHLLASRLVRQDDRRLTVVGVVHTHPGSLRHPSRGDLRGDRDWVPQLRGGEGVFGIGTADAATAPGTPVEAHPEPHMQALGGLRFSWYSLAAGEKKYKPLPVVLAIGPDLGKPLRPVWAAVEEYAERLERLARQQARVRFAAADGKAAPALTVTVPLAEPGHAVRVDIEGKEVRYYYEAAGETFQVALPDTPPDQGVYLILAELAARG